MTLTREQIIDVLEREVAEMRENDANGYVVHVSHLERTIELLRTLPLPVDGLSREKILGMWSDLESGRALPLAEDLRAVFSLALRGLPLPEDETRLPCDVMVAPRTIIRAGCKVSTLMLAIEQREKWAAKSEPVPGIDWVDIREPLPEGEVKELADRIKETYGGDHFRDVRQLADIAITQAVTLSRQAASLATANRAADAEMERVKACEHIACGDEGWEILRNECPSTAAVAGLRDAFEAAEASLASARRETLEEAAELCMNNSLIFNGSDAAARIRSFLSSPRQEGT